MSAKNSKGPKLSTTERVELLAQPLADELGLFLWDVRFEKEGATWYLRVLIDKDGGVTMDDCEAFARPFNKILDAEDPIPQSYVFECGSPGLGRELRRPVHFQVCVGDPVRVRLIRPDENGEREFIGVLTEYQEGQITCRLVNDQGEEQGDRSFKLSDTAFVKLYDDCDLDAELQAAGDEE